MAVCAVVLFSNIVMILLSYYSSRQDEAALFLYRCIEGDVRMSKQRLLRKNLLYFHFPSKFIRELVRQNL